MALLTAVLTGWFISSPETLSYLHLESWGFSKPEIPTVSTQTSPAENASSTAIPLGLRSLPSVPLETSELLGEQLRPFDSKGPEFLAVSPDGTHLAYMGNHYNEIFLVNILTGEEKSLVKTNFNGRGFLSDMRWRGNEQLVLYEAACGSHLDEVYFIDVKSGQLKFVDDILTKEEKAALTAEYGEDEIEVEGFYPLYLQKKLKAEFSKVPLTTTGRIYFYEYNRISPQEILVESDGVWLFRTDGFSEKILNSGLNLRGAVRQGNAVFFYLIDWESETGHVLVYKNRTVQRLVSANATGSMRYTMMTNSLSAEEGVWLAISNSDFGLIFLPSQGNRVYQSPHHVSGGFSGPHHSIFQLNSENIFEQKLAPPQ